MSLDQLQAAPRAQLLGLPDGVEGVRATLEIMARIVRASRVDPGIRNTALALTRHAGNFGEEENFFAEIEALHRFVRDNIRYVMDVDEVETVQTPDVTLRLEAGDCDDKSVLLASLLNAVGHPARFAAVAFAPDAFEHVLVETKLGDKWLPLETTKPVQVGWYPEGVVSKMLRHI